MSEPISERNRELMTLANQILDYLGGYGVIKMSIGAHKLLLLDEKRGGLRFRFKVSTRFNMVDIVLNDDDLFDCTYYRMGRDKLGIPVVRVKLVDKGIYNDMLASQFESITGLYLDPLGINAALKNRGV